MTAYLGSQCKQHGPLQEIRRERWAVVCALDADQRLAKVLEVEQVTEGQFGTGFLEGLRAGIVAANKCQHIPDKNEHTVCYYGAYSSRYRAKHHPSNASQQPTIEVTEPDTDTRRSARAAWAKLIFYSDRLFNPNKANKINGRVFSSAQM